MFSGTQFALVDDPTKMLPAAAQTLSFLDSDLGLGAVTVGLSIIMWAAGFITLRTKILPGLVGLGQLRLAVVALAGPIGF